MARGLVAGGVVAEEFRVEVFRGAACGAYFGVFARDPTEPFFSQCSTRLPAEITFASISSRSPCSLTKRKIPDSLRMFWDGITKPPSPNTG